MQGGILIYHQIVIIATYLLLSLIYKLGYIYIYIYRVKKYVLYTMLPYIIELRSRYGEREQPSKQRLVWQLKQDYYEHW